MAAREPATPPPVIGKAGPYTIFITPPATPQLSESSRSRSPSASPTSGSNLKFSFGNAAALPTESSRSLSESPRERIIRSNLGAKDADLPPPAVKAPAMVQVPPLQFEKGKGKGGRSEGSVFGFFWDAVARVQDAHSNLDQYLADWLGLDQSRYQWALNDYYENNGAGKDGIKQKELVSKGQSV